MLEAHLHKRITTVYGETDLEIKLEIKKGEFICISGESGSGKTTLLRMLAGLSAPDKGHISFREETWYDSDRKINIPARKRNIGLVFENYALFPNMNLRQNIEFALKEKSADFVEDLLRVSGLKTIEKRFPYQLSGGQQQRTALCRAMAARPHLFLFDEPLSAVDDETKAGLHQELKNACVRSGITTIMVSHYPQEIKAIASRSITLLKSGVNNKTIHTVNTADKPIPSDKPAD